MADDINSSASFGQSKNDSEELPIIVAQRFLNIFRQLHIFSDERREAFNKMLLELPPEVKSINVNQSNAESEKNRCLRESGER